MEPSFLLLTCTIHKNQKVANELLDVYGVQEAFPVYGTFDCVVKTNEMSDEDVKCMVSSTIRPLDDVISVLTLYPASAKLHCPNVR